MKIGIVIQGKYVKGYTLKVIQYYKNILNSKYDTYIICLSSWEGDIGTEEYKLLQKLDIEIILNKKPLISGHWNLNYQIISTKEGLKRIRELGCEIAIKTRTDFKWKIDYFIDYYLKQNHSKICCIESCDDSIGYPLVINDFIFIGKTDELSIFFDAPLSYYGHENQINELIRQNDIYKQILINRMHINFSNRHHYKQYDLFAEPYLVKYYLERKGNILPKNKVLLYYHSIFIMTLYFDLIVWDKTKMGGNNVKKHYLESAKQYYKYKNMIEKKQFIRLWIKSFFRATIVDTVIRIKYQTLFILHTVKYSFMKYKF